MRCYSVHFRYGVAIAATCVALLLTHEIQPLNTRFIFMLPFAAVVFSAWFGGTGPGILAITISGLAAAYFFLPPDQSFSIGHPIDKLALGIFVVVGLLVVFLTSTRRRAIADLSISNEALNLEIAERKESEADMQRLHSLSTQLLRKQELAPLLHEVLVASIELLGADKGNIQLYEADKTLKIAAAIGFDQEFLDYFKSVPAELSWCGEALKLRQRVIVENVFSDPRFADLGTIYASHGFLACQSTPLCGSNGKLFGMLSTHFRQPHRPSDRELRLLDLYAQQAERVIERMRAEEDAQRLNTELEHRITETEARLQLEQDNERLLEQVRRNLKEKETLLREIHHRVKNNMQIVSSLLNLEAAHVQTPDMKAAFSDSQARIQSMALVHDQLYGSTSLERIDAGTYINALTKHLIRSFAKERVKVSVRAVGITWQPDVAVKCGLMLNELLTNALKYAFPTGEGTITITVKEENGRGTLSVTDDGVGLPDDFDLDRVATLGLQLVTLLAEQLNGTVQVSRDTGTRFSVLFPPDWAMTCPISNPDTVERSTS